MKIPEYNRIRNCADDVIKRFESKEVVKYRVTLKIWRHILLQNKEKIIIDSCPQELTAIAIGAGVYEIVLKEEKCLK